jgi:hypothetical protein
VLCYARWESAPLHFRPQLHFLGGAAGLRRLDFVGRWEELQPEYARLLAAHDFGGLAIVRGSLPHHRASGGGGGGGAQQPVSGEVAEGRELEELARRVYAMDYEALGY